MTTNDETHRSDPGRRRPGHASAAVARRVRRIASETLLDNVDELVIEHRGREYRLRVTQNGKLILTA